MYAQPMKAYNFNCVILRILVIIVLWEMLFRYLIKVFKAYLHQCL